VAEFFGLKKAAEDCFPHPEGRPPHAETLRRAIRVGVKSRRDPRVRIRLRAEPYGRSWVVTREWCEDFLSAVATDRNGARVDRRDDRAKLANEILAADGW
jgi:hypothetical protein